MDNPIIYGVAYKQSKSDRCGISLRNFPLPTAGNQLGLYIATVDPDSALASSQLRAGMRIIFIAINGISYNTMIGCTCADASGLILESVGRIMITAVDDDQHRTIAAAAASTATAAAPSYTTLAASLQPDMQLSTQIANIQPPIILLVIHR